MIADAIFSQVTSNGPVAALIGTRLYPEYDKQADKVYPLAVYKVENVTPLSTNTGSAGLESADVIIAAIAPKYADAATLARAIVNALDCQKGTWTGIVVQGCFLKDDGIADNVVTEPTTEEILYHVKEITFTVWYQTI